MYLYWVTVQAVYIGRSNIAHDDYISPASVSINTATGNTNTNTTDRNRIPTEWPRNKQKVNYAK